MNIQNMYPLHFNACPEFWHDVKFIYKHTRKRELRPILEDETFSSFDDESKIDCIPYLKGIKNYIQNSCPNFDGISDIYHKQPFIAQGWQIRKLRYAIDSKGKSGGIRLIYCKNNDQIIFAYISLKNYIASESKLEKEFMPRLLSYLSP